ncbi:hypothetical protein OQA88_986 [Cercophora sp. LCS_1]
MPYLRCYAPLGVPDCETIESLLGLRNTTGKAASAVKPLQELTKEQRHQTELVALGKNGERIQGDPFGIWRSWSGNVSHHQDARAPCPEAAAANYTEYQTIRDNAEELVLTFRVGSKTVRLMQCFDLDATDASCYDRSARAKRSKERGEAQLSDPPMTAELTQYIMARLMTSVGRYIVSESSTRSEASGSSSSCKTRKHGVFYKLRHAAQEEYWLHMSDEERKEARETVLIGAFFDEDPLRRVRFDLVKANWQNDWNNEGRNPDFFRDYKADHLAARNAWEDVVDGYIRKIHPELDPTKATVEALPNAKMCVARYGTWAMTGDSQGRYIGLTGDSLFTRILSECCFPRKIVGWFCRAAFGKASEMLRFLMKPLDEEYYKECVEMVANVDKEDKFELTDEDFVSSLVLGVNGHIQRRKDSNDIKGGLAGLCTFGNYHGGELCIPQLNLKVPYKPGTCAIIRGTDLAHLVSDYSGPRYFLIGTNRQNVKRHVWRKLGKLPPLPDDDDSIDEDPDDDIMEMTCFNTDHDTQSNGLCSNNDVHEFAAHRNHSSSWGSLLD